MILPSKQQEVQRNPGNKTDAQKFKGCFFFFFNLIVQVLSNLSFSSKCCSSVQNIVSVKQKAYSEAKKQRTGQVLTGNITARRNKITMTSQVLVRHMRS